MDGMRNPWKMKQLMIVWAIIIFPNLILVSAYYQPGTWKYAHATFYGDETASETMGGACGYGNLHKEGYGVATAALSTVLFNNGKSCGQCFQLKCVDSKWCFPFVPAITITGTNLCPPNWYQASNAGGWCNPPRPHFDLSKPIFMRFAIWRAGIVPVKYRRVPCQRKGGIRFRFQGNPHWLLVYITNVGGGGDVSNMWVKGSKTGWMKMTRNWGAAFQVFSQLGGQPLSFKLQSGSTYQTITASYVTSSYWSIGQTYQGTANFR
ncbi:hypothetical protein V2J09_004769 [Rumex salicifolius]